MEQQRLILACVHQHNTDQETRRRTSKHEMPTVYVCKFIAWHAYSAECNNKLTSTYQHNIWRVQKVVCKFQKNQPILWDSTASTQQVLLRSDKFRLDCCSTWSKTFLIWPSSQQRRSSWPSSSSSSRLCSVRLSTYLGFNELRKSSALKLIESNVLSILSTIQTSNVSSEYS